MPDLRPYQERAKEVLIKSLLTHGSALDASDCGVGKTYTACAVAADLRRPVAIICPKTVISNWTKVAESFGLNPVFVLNYEKLKGGRTEFLKRHGNTAEWVRLEWKLPHGTLIIWDEVHYCKSFRSINSAMLVTSKNNRDDYLNLMLSATAAESPLDMRALGYLLGLHKYKDFWNWAFSNGVTKNRWKQMVFNGDKEILKQIHGNIFNNENRGCRIRIKDLGDDFPHNHVAAETYDIGHEKEINEAYQEAIEEVSSRRLTELGKRGIVSLRGRQVAEKYKVPLLVELAGEIMKENKSVVIFVNFKDTVKKLCAGLDSNCTIVGDQTDKERAKNIGDFQSNNSHIIICNTQAGGQSVSLHDESGNRPRVSLICPTFDAIQLQQALGRIHRNGGKSKCVQKIICAANTVEDRVCSSVNKKINNINTLNNSDLL